MICLAHDFGDDHVALVTSSTPRYSQLPQRQQHNLELALLLAVNYIMHKDKG